MKPGDYKWTCPKDGVTECPSAKCWAGDGCPSYDENGNWCAAMEVEQPNESRLTKRFRALRARG